MEKEIAIFSDIHGNLQALISILKDIKEKGIKDIYCLGDVIAGGPNSRECLDLIIENNIKMVLGNHEMYYLKGTDIDDEKNESEIEHQNWIRSLLNDRHKQFLDTCSMVINEKIGNYTFAFQHFLLNPDINDPYPFDEISIINDGSIEDKVKRLDADITFIGHEHSAFEYSVGNKKLIDIGSSGCTNDENTFYTILSIQDNKINIRKMYLKYDRKEFEKIFRNTVYPEKDVIGKIFFGINN